MDAKDRLRLYLEQRRELGEQDLVLDQLPVEDVLAMLGARARDSARVRVSRAEQPSSEPVSESPASLESPPPPPAPRFDANAASSDWRTTLRATGLPPAANAAAATNADAGSRDTGKTNTGNADSILPPWLAALELPPGVSVGTKFAMPADSNMPASIDDIAAAIAQCTACPLHATAKRSVPGEGDPHADFVCVGEAPGQNEDESGRTFVGAAGQLLTKILGAIDLSREQVFICNVLKHRPPGNRNPLPEEVHACRPFLEQQLALLRPRVIVALGTFAAQTLLNTTQSLGALRGRLHFYHGVPLIVTYHPAALLRNEAWKRPTWQDVQLARRIHDASQEANPA